MLAVDAVLWILHTCVLKPFSIGRSRRVSCKGSRRCHWVDIYTAPFSDIVEIAAAAFALARAQKHVSCQIGLQCSTMREWQLAEQADFAKMHGCVGLQTPETLG